MANNCLIENHLRIMFKRAAWLVLPAIWIKVYVPACCSCPVKPSVGMDDINIQGITFIKSKARPGVFKVQASGI